MSEQIKADIPSGQPPRMEMLVEELRAGLKSGDLRVKGKKNFMGGDIPDWPKIEELYKKHGFVQNRDRRDRPITGWKAGDGEVLDNDIIRFWAELSESNEAILKRGTQCENTVGAVRQFLETENISPSGSSQLLDEVFKRISASRRKEGYEIIYRFSDGEISLKAMGDFLNWKGQREGIRAHNRAVSEKKQEQDAQRREAEEFWKKYD